MDILRWVDYLSTVSGGGYIGSWLAAWIKRVASEPPNTPVGKSKTGCPHKNPRAYRRAGQSHPVFAPV